MTELEAGRMLLNYRLEQHLGAGAMGVVWKATDLTLGREVAVKILPEALAGDPERLARFDREARLLASLNHPNIAAVYGLHEAGGVHFLAMELVKGRTLTEEMAQGLTPGRVIALGAAIAEGVAAAHRQHVTHRDLKPDNIMVDGEGRPKVLDFGLATPGELGGPLEATRSLMTRQGSVMGTIAYMSPEQAQGRPVDPRSDVFSLGIVLYEMATGQRPFGGDSAIEILSSILRDTPRPVPALAPATPARLDRIIRRCLEKNPDLRYKDASALHEDLAGVSWYEAAAYAEWAGKSLPTIFHWNRVAFTVGSSRIVPQANFAGSGPVAAGTTKSMNRFGVSDLAGNVREWTWNASGRAGGRYILGGGWNDPDYAFNDAFAQQPFDRSATNGFRCIRYLEAEPNLAVLQQGIEQPRRDFKAEKPASDGVFAQYVRQFTYDRTPLNARLEEELHTPGWVRQKLTFDAAYGGERMMAYLFLPVGGKPPYKTVVDFPGSGSIDTRSSANLEPGRADFVVQSGRALLWPIYKGTYERGGDLHSDIPSTTASYRDYVLMWGKDLSRSIDYLETRKDLDTGHLAYFGLSWGGALGAILPAVEPRLKVNILYVAGLCFQHALPEVDAINYLGRVRQPTLILNGENDFFFPSETSQKPMFELLGTPKAQKKRLVFPGGHSVPRMDLIREALAWLDTYQGPV
jgi:dienelactone hydrolase